MNLTVFYIVYFLGYVGFSSTIPIIPLYLNSLGSGFSETGMIVSLMFWVAAVLMIPFGILSDRTGPRRVILVGLSIIAFAPLLLAYATSPLQVVLVRIFQGIGSAMYMPSALSLVIALAPVEKRGEATGWVVAAGQMGLMCGPLAGGFLLQNLGFRGAFFGCFFLSLLGLVMAAIFYRSKVETVGNKPQEPGPLSRGWLKESLIIAAFVVPLIMALGSGVLNTFMPLYGTKYAISEAQIGSIIAIYYASSSVLRAPFAKMTDRYGARPVIVGGSALFAAGMALFSLGNSFLYLSLVAVVFGLGFGLAFPAGMVIVANQAPVHARGMAIAIYGALFQAGIALGNTTMGFVAAATSLETMFQVAGLIMILGALIFYLLTRRKAQPSPSPLR